MGPFPISWVLGPVTYEVKCRQRPWTHKRLHVNHIKCWEEHEETPATIAWVEEAPRALSSGALSWTITSSSLALEPPRGLHLNPDQQQDLGDLLQLFPGLFSTRPGRTPYVQHSIPMPPGHWVQMPFRLVPRKRWDQMEQEVQDMLRFGVIERAHGPWRSTIMLVPKPDGCICFCIDFCKVNKLAHAPG